MSILSFLNTKDMEKNNNIELNAFMVKAIKNIDKVINAFNTYNVVDHIEIFDVKDKNFNIKVVTVDPDTKDHRSVIGRYSVKTFFYQGIMAERLELYAIAADMDFYTHAKK